MEKTDDYHYIKNSEYSNKDEFLLVENKSDTLLIIFAGFGMSGKLPIFIFKNFLKKYNCDKLFLRDLNKLWFLRKTKETLEKDERMNKILNFIKRVIKPRHKKIYTLGCSSGGFASILYGHLLNVNKCIAFCPQTLIGKQLSIKFNDNRYQPNQTDIECKSISKEYLDLKNLIPFNMDTHIYYSTELDKKHAYNIIHQNCYLIRVPGDEHETAFLMRKTNTLEDVLDNLLLDYKIISK